MISISNLSYRYPESDDWALQSINLEISKGEFCSIIGPNGAGKSTLAYAISGYVPHFFKGQIKGKVLLEKRNIRHSTLGQLSADVGLVFQNPFNQITGTKYTVREEIAFGMENLGIEAGEMEARILQALATVGLENESERSPYSLSGGQQQRVAIAAMLVMKPKILILDEPTSQLDPHATHAVFETLAKLAQESQTSIVMIEHKFEWVAKFSDRVYLLDQGKLIAEGLPEDILASEALKNTGLKSTRFSQIAQALIKRKLIPKPNKMPSTLKHARNLLA